MTNVMPGMQNNYAVDDNSPMTPYGIPYHYDSVMQYKPNTLALDRTKFVMTAIVAPVFDNTAKMGNNAPICGAMDSDWDMLNRVYCLSSQCVDTDIMCGWGPLQGSQCSDPTVSAKCPKTCLSGACASGPAPGTNPATTTKGPDSCTDTCKSTADCCACNTIFSRCMPTCSGDAGVCNADPILSSNCPRFGGSPCCHWSGVCSCVFGANGCSNN